MATVGKITLPVPLKHRTETALLLVLAVMISVVGVMLALLPPFSRDIFWIWIVFLIVIAAYPLSMRGFLRRNRADYEFRALHAFPALMILLWAVLQMPLGRYPALRVFFDGLFGFFSIPMVALGLFLLALFSWQVLRRRTVRIMSIGIIFVLFAGFSLLRGGMDSPRVHSAYVRTVRSVSLHFSEARQTVWQWWKRDAHVASDQSNRVSRSSSSLPSTTSSVSSDMDYLQVRPDLPVAIDSRTPVRLAGSGPMDAPGILVLLTLASYSFLLHVRSRRSIDRA